MGTLSMVARSVGGRLLGSDAEFRAVSTDTRTLKARDLFFALRGERFDAGQFVAEAERLGAAGAVVERRQAVALPQVEVADTRLALGDFAAAWRARFRLPLVAITGSNGKTTVKEMTGAILRAEYASSSEAETVLVTWGNLNNDIGVPMTLFYLRDQHRAAVIEMGANRKGEIARLTAIAAPTVGIVTNAGPAHLAGFGGSVRDVAIAKGELFAGLPPTATAVINRDDEFYEYWRGLRGSGENRTFGLSADADFRASDVRESGDGEFRFRMHTPAGEIAVRLPMAGRHNVRNALAAAAGAHAAGAGPEAIRDGLATMRNVAGRLRLVAGRNGATVYDDTYNANPGSVAAAIEFLAGLEGERWLVLGDMAELGAEAELLHRELGRLARARGLQRLFAVGELSRHAADAFGAGGSWHADVPALAAGMAGELRPGVTVLVKGSRRMGLETLVASLAESPDAGGAH
jgi:UDP-N-acetylmuramoyl-tripeptide--D-alanyl-D-alanine ligase